MDVIPKIRLRMEAVQAKLLVADRAMQAEMEKPFQVRKRLVLDFLYKEKVMYEFFIAEMEKILKEIEVDENL